MKAFLGLVLTILCFSHGCWASAGSCLEIWVKDKELYQQYMDVIADPDFSFGGGYRGFVRLAELRQPEINFFADHLPRSLADNNLVMLAARVTDGYEPARSFVLEIAKTFAEFQAKGENPEAYMHLVNYYETMFALDVVGVNVLRFAQAVNYDVVRGAEILNLQKRLEEGEGVPSYELEGVPTVDDILIHAIQ